MAASTTARASTRAKARPRVKPAPIALLRVDLVAWRAWLRLNHTRELIVWLAFTKAGSKPEVSQGASLPMCYDDALDEALCWGWVDSMVRRVDDVTYARKFTRRVNASKWSGANLERLRRLVGTPRMRPRGLAMIAADTLALVKSDAPIVAKPRSTSIPEELTAALLGSPKGRKAFEALPPSHRREYCQWVSEAKRPQTRARRAAQAIARLIDGAGLAAQ